MAAALLAGCTQTITRNVRFDALAATRWNSSQRIAAAAALETKPWKIGQWVLYQHSYQGKTFAFERISIVALDRCGVWFEWVQDAAVNRVTEYICLRCLPNPTNRWDIAREQLQLIVRQPEGGSPRLTEFVGPRERNVVIRALGGSAPARTLYLHSRQVVQGVPEATDVPAGHFDALLATYGDTDVWSNAKVPFGGVVRTKDRNEPLERVLLAYGDSGATSDVAELGAALAQARASRAERWRPQETVEPEQPVRQFAIVALGVGGWSRVDNAAPSASGTWAFHAGQRLATGLHLVEEAHASYGSYSPDPTATETHAALLVGVRWSPFRSSRRKLSSPALSLYPSRYLSGAATYVKASVGAGVRDRWVLDMNHTKWAPIANVAIGWLPIQGHDWALGLELREQIAFSEGFQRDWALVFLTQVSN